MNARTQITLDPEMQRRAHEKAAELGISPSYLNLIEQELIFRTVTTKLLPTNQPLADGFTGSRFGACRLCFGAGYRSGMSGPRFSLNVSGHQKISAIATAAMGAKAAIVRVSILVPPTTPTIPALNARLETNAITIARPAAPGSNWSP